VAEIRDFGELKKNIVIGSPGNFGTGGIATKISAAELAAGFGISTVIAHGGKPRAVEALASGVQRATVFLA
jgi:glutamate 5-kinase